MTRRELNCAIAHATGESVCEIRRRGFSIADPEQVCFDPEPDLLPPQFLDWDDFDLRRNVPLIEQPPASLLKLA